MGLLISADSVATEIGYLDSFGTGIANTWNDSKAQKFGVAIQLHRGSLANIASLGKRLFDSSSFSRPPGPFKRVAALVVLGRLFPFFAVVRYNEAPTKRVQLPRHETNAWLARFMSLAIGPAMAHTSVILNGVPKQLDPWSGFPSDHYKLELLNWLRWLDLGRVDGPGLEFERLVRMVMALSLILEASYYATHSERPPEICGATEKCFESLTEEHYLDLIFDRPLDELEAAKEESA